MSAMHFINDLQMFEENITTLFCSVSSVTLGHIYLLTKGKRNCGIACIIKKSDGEKFNRLAPVCCHDDE